MKFIYAQNEEERQILLARGFEEITSCQINGNTAYVFENSPLKFATFSREDQHKYLVTNVAFFV